VNCAFLQVRSKATRKTLQVCISVNF